MRRDVLGLHLLREGAVLALAHRARRETVGSQSPVSQRVRRPTWVSWIISAQSCAWMRVGELLQHRDDRGRRQMSIWPNADGLSAATLDEPPNMVSAMPPLAFSSW